MESLNILNFFDKNKYDLKTEINNNILGSNKEECFYETINNNYDGFVYEGDYNKCYLFNSTNFNNNNEIYEEEHKEDSKNWNKYTFIKGKGTIDIKNIDDQNKYISYFDKINNNYMSNDLINKSIVSNQDECLLKCIKEKDKCESLIYVEQPKKCTFYNNKIMKNHNINKNKNYDIYTTNKNNINKYKNNLDLLINEYNKSSENNENIIENNILLYNCNGLMSTNPFCTKEFNLTEDSENKLVNYSDCIDFNNFNNKNEEEKILNNACRKKYGNDYIYDNDISNTENIINCNNGNKKVKCKIQFIDNNIVENYRNLEQEQIKKKNKYFVFFSKNDRIIVCLLFFILLIIFIIKLT